MKKFIAILLTVVLTATSAIGGTLAWLTDRDSDAMVYTIGNVDIELNYQGENVSSSKTLLPHKLIEDKPYITNTGNTDALVWFTLLVPDTLYSVENYSKSSALRVNAKGCGNGVAWNKVTETAGAVEIDGVSYAEITFLREAVLKPGESTSYFFNNITLHYTVDIDPDGNMYRVYEGEATPVGWNIEEDGAPNIYYTAYAFQADYSNYSLYPDTDKTNGNNDGEIDVYEAYAAYKKQWLTNNNAVTTTVADPDVTDPETGE